MKITSSALRKLILSEIQRATRPRRYRQEPIKDFSHGGSHTYEGLVEIQEDWTENYDDGAPNWAAQCQAARDELESMWAAAYNEVFEKLQDGQYELGAGMPDEGDATPRF